MNKLVAALACRVQGSRLYGKPLQHLDVDSRLTILDHVIATIKSFDFIGDIVLGISEGIENMAFVDAAKSHGIRYVWGDKKDVLQRLIDCCRLAAGSHVFRVTTECPFIYHEAIPEAWTRHVRDSNDVTVIDGLPDGAHFEIYTLDALQRSHDYGDDTERSEFCSRYVVNHRSEFKVEILEPPPKVARMDLRLTVDYPEDLYVCRQVFAATKSMSPLIPLERIVDFLDANPHLTRMLTPYLAAGRIWK